VAGIAVGEDAAAAPDVARPRPPLPPLVKPARRARTWSIWHSCAVAAIAAVAASWSAMWNAPLNIDEEVTISVAEKSVTTIWNVVWGARGGGPLHFLLEHFALMWPGGLIALRLPSLVFFVLALPGIALLARELVAEEEARLTPLLLALAPLAVSYATFGRPHMLFLATFVWATWFAFRAGRLGGRRRWAIAGLLLASLAYIHPTAPLYAWIALAAAFLYAWPSSRRAWLEALPALAAFVAVSVPYYVHALGVLRSRYAVHEGAPRGRTYTGNSVQYDATHALAPFPAWLFVTIAVIGFLALAWRRWRSAVILAAMVVAPVVFFMLVPASNPSARFFTRYMLPSEPAFSILLACGIVALARLARARIAIVLVLVALLCAFELSSVISRRMQISKLELPRLAEVVRGQADDAVLFTPVGNFAAAGTFDALTRSRPPRLLGRYLDLSVRGLAFVPDDSCAAVGAFLSSKQERTRGLWIFYVTPSWNFARENPFRRVRGVTATPVGGNYVVVRSHRLRPPWRLLRLGSRLRGIWAQFDPADPDAAILAATDRCRRR
jgi:Dolichyl-phosphate-mannose-protein mannosyltransferase